MGRRRAPMRFVTGDGVDLYYEIIGTGDRVILTHGSWGDGNSWAGVVETLAAGHEVVTWDRRGHSRSGDGTAAGSFQRDADDLVELAQYLGGLAFLIGSSSGASIVLKALAGHGADIASGACVHEADLVGLLDPSVHGGDLGDEPAENPPVIEMVRAGDAESAARYFIDEIAVGPGTWHLLPEKSRAGFVTNASTVIDEFDDVFDPEPVDLARLDAFGDRLMITRGTESPRLLIAVAEELERLLPGADHPVLEGTGHIPYRTHPEMWYRVVLDQIRSL